MVRRAAALAVCALAAGCGGTSDAGPLSQPAPTGDGIGLEEAQRQPPTPIPGLEAEAAPGAVHLRWLASPDTRYRILRSTGGEERELDLVRVPAPGAHRYTDRGVRAGTTYRYRVVPENRWGLPGEPSETVTVRAR